MRIGVLSDTHVGDVLPVLPPEALSALTGVDLIIHAGDVVIAGTLARLREVAPVVAVQGNHDRKGGLQLPRAATVRAGEHRIGVIHGDQPRLRELPAAIASLAAGRVLTLGLESRLVRELDAPDVLVFGHLHVPVRRHIGRTLVFSPGSVYLSNRDSEYRPSGPVQRGTEWFRSRLPTDAREPAIGIIDAAPGRIDVSRVPLSQPLRPMTAEQRGRAVRSPANG